MYISGNVAFYLHGTVKNLLAIPEVVENWGARMGASVDLILEEDLMELEDLEDEDPEEIATVSGEVELSECPMEWLAEVAAQLPEVEIALVAVLDYSVCGSALYTCYSPAGSSALMPENWGGEWFPLGKEAAAWETSIKEAGVVDLGFPADVDWVDFVSCSEDEDDENRDGEDEEEPEPQILTYIGATEYAYIRGKAGDLRTISDVAKGKNWDEIQSLFSGDFDSCIMNLEQEFPETPLPDEQLGLLYIEWFIGEDECSGSSMKEPLEEIAKALPELEIALGIWEEFEEGTQVHCFFSSKDSSLLMEMNQTDLFAQAAASNWDLEALWQEPDFDGDGEWNE